MAHKHSVIENKTSPTLCFLTSPKYVELFSPITIAQKVYARILNGEEYVWRWWMAQRHYYVLAYGLLAPPFNVALYSAFAFATSATDLLDDVNDDEKTWKRPSSITCRSFDECEFANMPARGFDDGNKVKAVFSTEFDMSLSICSIEFRAGSKGWKEGKMWAARAGEKWDAALQTWCGEQTHIDPRDV
ncbi:hypothetical protein BDY19DRAFT_1044746 [Irpex rosettiformis]|uniref:Uncharacterized protein n=1 Tax=Irpex rosettiformis TaxID=378272 RepID=A0ACB8ULC4_9APHY|nr:hypothetical protein BDY19DRAFT_1044746 [Irpex rosettiformis]